MCFLPIFVNQNLLGDTLPRFIQRFPNIHRKGWFYWIANRSANVTAYVEPEIKQQTEKILEQLEMPVAVPINTLYRQIIMRGGVSYPLVLPRIPTRNKMTTEQFDVIMGKGYQQAINGQTLEIDEAFEEIHKSI